MLSRRQLYLNGFVFFFYFSLILQLKVMSFYSPKNFPPIFFYWNLVVDGINWEQFVL